MGSVPNLPVNENAAACNKKQQRRPLGRLLNKIATTLIRKQLI